MIPASARPFKPRILIVTCALAALFAPDLVTAERETLAQGDTTTPVSATRTMTHITRSVADTGESLVKAILGPDATSHGVELPPLPPDASCEALYNRVTALLPQSRRTRGNVFEDSSSSLFAGLGTIASPAFYLLGLTEYARIAEGRFVDEVSSKLEALRKRLAQKMCFVH